MLQTSLFDHEAMFYRCNEPDWIYLNFELPIICNDLGLYVMYLTTISTMLVKCLHVLLRNKWLIWCESLNNWPIKIV